MDNFAQQVEAYRAVVSGALTDAKSLVSATDQLGSHFLFESGRLEKIIDARGIIYSYLRQALSVRGRAEIRDLEVLNSASEVAFTTRHELSRLHSKLLEMIASIKSMQV